MTMEHRLQAANIFAAIALVAYFSVSTFAASVITAFPGLPYPDMITSLILYVFGFGIPCFVFAFFLKKKEGTGIAKTLGFRKLPFPSVIICIVLGLLFQPVGAFLAQISSKFFGNITSIAVTSMTVMPLPLLVFTMAVMPAFFEELLCRGVLFGNYKETPVWYQILIPALFFGFLHMNFQQISYAFPLGVLLASVYYLTDSLYASMIIHLVLNGTQVTIAWLQEAGVFFNGSTFLEKNLLLLFSGSDNLFETLIIALGAGALIAILFCFLGRMGKVREREKRVLRPGWHKGGWIMYLLLGVLFIVSLLVEVMLKFLPQLEAFL